MPQPPQDKPVRETNPRAMFDPLYNLVTIYTGVLIPLIHSGLGTRGQSPFIYTLFLMFGYSVFGECPHILLYIPAWLLCVTYRACTPDKYQHSTYRGFPWLACLLPFVNTEKKGRLVEPFIVFFAGLYLMAYSVRLGQFVIGAGTAMCLLFMVELAAIAPKSDPCMTNGSRRSGGRIWQEAEMDGTANQLPVFTRRLQWQETQRFRTP